MKRWNDRKDRNDKSNGIEILVTEVFVKIYPTDPLKLGQETTRNNQIDPVIHQTEKMIPDEC